MPAGKIERNSSNLGLCIKMMSNSEVIVAIFDNVGVVRVERREGGGHREQV
jgi:hypothetical protein